MVNYEDLFAPPRRSALHDMKKMAGAASTAYLCHRVRFAIFQTALPVPSILTVTALRREMRGIAIALAWVAAMTAVALVLRHYVGILRGAVLYLVPVMIAGYQYGVIPALIAAIAGVIMSGYVYFAQLYSFQVASPQEALNLVLFMVVAVFVSHLANKAK